MTQTLSGGTHHIFSLQRKLSALMSCVIAIACTSLGWFFFEQYISLGVQDLQKQGMLLAENLSRTGRYSVLSQDHIRLNQFIESTLQSKEIVYVIFGDSEGHILASGTKGMLQDQRAFTRFKSDPLFPSPRVAQALAQSGVPTPIITPLRFSNGRQQVLTTNHGKAGKTSTTFFIQNSETVFDFTAPIFRQVIAQDPNTESSWLLFEEKPEALSPSKDIPQFQGFVQIGLSDVYLQKDMRTIFWQVCAMTFGIIGLGIVITVVVSSRITRPLNTLTAMASRIMKGDVNPRLSSTTEDEIGELTHTFNRMALFLREKDRATAKHLKELQILSHSGALVSSPMEISDVLSSVVDVLTLELGFSRVVAGLYDIDTQRLSYVYTKGFPEDLTRALHTPELVISSVKHLVAGLLCQANLSLQFPLPADTWHLDYPMLRTAVTFQVGTRRMIPGQGAANKVIFLAADKGPIQCAPFDIDLIRTLANYLSVAIDKIFAYQKLESLNQTLESRVRERTDDLEMANSKLKDLDRLKTTFVSIASHELRTPLTSIKMFVSNMTEGIGGPLSQEHSEYLARIQANVDRLQRMISELLDISQIESGRMKLSIEPLYIQDIAHDAIDSLLHEAKEKGVSVTVNSENALPTIEGDRDKIFQILCNLLHNAVKFSSLGDSVLVGIQQKDEEHIEIYVEDHGCGIDTADLDNIFLTFYQSTSSMPTASGAGLGLALCRHLVDLHQGKLWVESSLRKGSCFHVVLPVSIAPSPVAEAQQEFR